MKVIGGNIGEKKMPQINKINGSKDLYDRMCLWMQEMEGVTAGTPSPDPYTTRGAKMAEEAMLLMYDIYKTCQEK